MARTLLATVYVDGIAYKAGTKEGDLPADVRKQVTNPSAWAEPEDAAGSRQAQPEPRRAEAGPESKRSSDKG